jgi:hypothetical protein
LSHDLGNVAEVYFHRSKCAQLPKPSRAKGESRKEKRKQLKHFTFESCLNVDSAGFKASPRVFFDAIKGLYTLDAFDAPGSHFA